MADGTYKKGNLMSNSIQLNELNLQNFATFEDQSISFSDGLNTIIGETGSGKSLILDALQLILGGRAEKKLIRKDCEFACVEATFTVNDDKIKDYFMRLGHPFEEEVVIKRIIHSTGKSKAYLNFQQCPVSTLISAGSRFIDLVGQFENQKLFDEQYQISLLDNFSDNLEVLKIYRETKQEYTSALSQVNALVEKRKQTIQRSDYLNFQLSELESLSPDESEEQELKRKKQQILQIEKNQSCLQEINFLFNGNDEVDGVLPRISRLEKVLSTTDLDEAKLIRLKEIQEDLNDIYYSATQKLDYEFTEEELGFVIERLDLYKKLQRKYQCDTNQLIKIMSDLKAESRSLENLEEDLNSAQKRTQALETQLGTLATKLHDRRLKSSKILSEMLTGAVQDLRMQGASFRIELEKTNNYGQSGQTRLELLAEINPGEGFHRVKDIASGGELSRILLALRQVLSSKDSVSIFFFDEIDTGIGGETALFIGKSLRKVSQHSQVIAITHLPQIANFSETILNVCKDVQQISGKERTVSRVRTIRGENIKEFVHEMTPLSD